MPGLRSTCCHDIFHPATGFIQAGQIALLAETDKQAERRAWLASMRSKLDLDKPDPNDIEVEELAELKAPEAQEYSRETLDHYMETLAEEIGEPQ